MKMIFKILFAWILFRVEWLNTEKEPKSLQLIWNFQLRLRTIPGYLLFWILCIPYFLIYGKPGIEWIRNFIFIDPIKWPTCKVIDYEKPNKLAAYSVI